MSLHASRRTPHVFDWDHVDDVLLDMDGTLLDRNFDNVLFEEALPRRYPSAGDVHRERLAYELDVVKTTGFASYILLVWDYVAWARKQGIACGPRGSAAGSIIL